MIYINLRSSSDDKNLILNRIESLCIQNGYSKYRLCKQAGISKSTLFAMYSRNLYPSIPTLIKICSVLNISLYEFFSYESHEKIFPDLIPSKKELELLNSMRQLSFSQQEQIFSYVDALCGK